MKYIALCFHFLIFSLCTGNPVLAAVSYQAVALDPKFPEAAKDMALQWACAPQVQELEEYFRKEGLAFSSQLVRSKAGRHCHIAYRPSVPGFRALPDSGKIRQLVIAQETPHSLFMRSSVWGDRWDILRHLNRSMSSDVPFLVILKDQFSESLYQNFLRRLKEVSSRDIQLMRTNNEPPSWIQDAFISGRQGDKPLTLVAYRVYEGNPGYGNKYSAFLDEMASLKGFARSQLAWEGGDLVVTENPLALGRTILFYGNTSKGYWGNELSDQEFNFILKTEFGVDEAVNIAAKVGHVDFFLLPLDSHTLMVRRGVTENVPLTCDILEIMMNDFNTRLRVNPKGFNQLKWKICSMQASDSLQEVLPLFEAALAEFELHREDWVTNQSFIPHYGKFEEFINKTCLNDFNGKCSDELDSSAGLEKLMAFDAKLLDNYLDSQMDGISNSMRFGMYIDLLKGQLNKVNPQEEATNIRIRDQLREMGFKVIEVEYPLRDDKAWAGYSPLNSLVHENTIFMPSLGLKRFDQRSIDRLQAQTGLDVVLVPSLKSLVNNAGVHCAIKSLR